MEKTIQKWMARNGKHYDVVYGRLSQLAMDGISAQDWYENSRQAIVQAFGERSDLFIDILSVTSPRNSVKGNLTIAIRAFDVITKGYKITKKLKVGLAGENIRRNLKAIQAGESYSGIKVQTFAQALKGDWSVVVVDSWMVQAIGLNKVAPAPNDRKIIVELVKRLADQMGLAPAQCQACIWYGIKQQSTKWKNASDFAEYLRQMELFT